jgi:hypothetical protein
MTEEDAVRKEVDQFITDEIDSVPHLEALLLLWNSRPRHWTTNNMAQALYTSEEVAGAILTDLERRGLVTTTPAGEFAYGSSGRDRLIEALDRVYRREVVRISRLIHSKPSASVREFARAFRLKKDKD